MAVLSGIDYKKVFTYFEEISNVPRVPATMRRSARTSLILRRRMVWNMCRTSLAM